ncbi:MAG: methyltransferase family protein [Pseudomonadota bacterium]
MGFAIRAAVALGIADALADAPRDIASLAEAVDADSHGLLRLMRALAAKGVFEECAPETFRGTAIGRLLRRDHPAAVAEYLRTMPAPTAYVGLDGGLRSPQYALDECLDEHAPPNGLSALETEVALAIHPWREAQELRLYGHGCDAFCAALLREHPDMRIQAIGGDQRWWEHMASEAGALTSSSASRSPMTHCVIGGVSRLDDRDLSEAIRGLAAACRFGDRALLIDHFGRSDDLFARASDLSRLAAGRRPLLRALPELLVAFAACDFSAPRITSTPALCIVDLEHKDEANHGHENRDRDDA